MINVCTPFFFAADALHLFSFLITNTVPRCTLSRPQSANQLQVRVLRMYCTMILLLLLYSYYNTVVVAVCTSHNNAITYEYHLDTCTTVVVVLRVPLL